MGPDEVLFDAGLLDPASLAQGPDNSRCSCLNLTCMLLFKIDHKGS